MTAKVQAERKKARDLKHPRGADLKLYADEAKRGRAPVFGIGNSRRMRMEPSRIRRLRRQAEAGDAYAQYELGCVYYCGDGVKRDYAEALKWYRAAAAQGNNSGLCDLGFCYRNGHGVAQDYAKAIPYYQKAADQGCPTAAYWLAYAYEHGQGVERDARKAEHWYRIARSRGDPDADEGLARLRAS